MASNFITNSGTKNLGERIRELVLRSKELKFLVGFFYYSGLKELYQALKENPHVKMKVLVGMDADVITNRIVELEKFNDNNVQVREEFFNSLKNVMRMSTFDSEEFYEQAEFFLELIKQGRLEIRKTKNPNHAKLYIFEMLDPILRKGVFITGSSNLTLSGLVGQEEFNVEISDYGFDEAREYFDKLWEDSVDIETERLVSFLKKETHLREIKPIEAYAFVLKAYLDSFEKREDVDKRIERVMKMAGYVPYRYQKDAIKQALDILQKHGGLILADVVGLGKTVIACTLASLLEKKGVVVCPPALVESWNSYKEQFYLYDWNVWSLGKLEELKKAIKEDVQVVIVDEAHRFRNENTKSYELLKNICRGRQVILLTATPFNNRPSDIFSLLKLFIIPQRSSITLDENVLYSFKKFEREFEKLSYIKKYHNAGESKREKANKYYEEIFGTSALDLSEVERRIREIGKEVREIIQPVTIRRNRLDLLSNPEYAQEIKSFPEVNDPLEWFYELSPKQLKFYDEVLECFKEDGAFKGAVYRPADYMKVVKDEFEKVTQHNLFDFMRRLLVRRLESSFGAFQRSIERFKDYYQKVLDFVQREKKHILKRSLLEKIYDMDPEDVEKELNTLLDTGKELVYELKDLDKSFLEHIKADIELFDSLLGRMQELRLIEQDPKVEALIRNLQDSLSKEKNRKIIVFSEYVDTVEYLQERLEKRFRVLTISGQLNKEKLSLLLKNFDASYEEQEDNYDILLTTDKLSEGFNLNRAGMVVNYDIPWNPVRVIQRLGRINRIGKKLFDKIYIVNFFPTEKGAELVKSREIASQKLFLIHNILGEDAKIFDPEEEPSPSALYRKIQQNPDQIEKESPYTKVLKAFNELKKKYPHVVREIENLPKRLKVAKLSNENELLVFIKKGMLYAYRVSEKEPHPVPVLIEDVLDKIKADINDKPLALSDRFWEWYEKVKKVHGTQQGRYPERSLEAQAINVLETLKDSPDMYKYIEFLNTLLEDIKSYGTLPDYTLRRIVNIKEEKDIQSLMEDLGQNYLQKEKGKLKDMEREIIIAIENQMPSC